MPNLKRKPINYLIVYLSDSSNQVNSCKQQLPLHEDKNPSHLILLSRRHHHRQKARRARFPQGNLLCFY